MIRQWPIFTALIGLVLAGAVVAQPPRESAKPADDVQDFVFMGGERPLLIRAHVRVDGKSFRAAWDDYVGKVFKFLDANSDGVVNKAELERMPPMAFLTGGLAAFGGRITSAVPMENIDSNKDGKADRDEVATFLRRNGAAPFQIGSASLNPYGPRVISLDAAPAASSADAVNDAIFAVLDANKDGKLSKDELAKAPAAFAAKDANDDEMVTAQEIAPNAGGARGMGADAIKLAVRDGMPAAPADSRVMLVHPGETGDSLARQLLARYGTKANQAGSKKLKAADLALDQATFARLDADKDGALDAEELAQFARRAPDVEITVRIGSKDDGAAQIEGSVRTGGADAKLVKNDSGAVSLEMGVTRVELRVGAATNNSNIRIPQLRLREQYVNQFKAADTDGNGYLDEKEINNNRAFVGLHKALDADGNGMLYEKEIIAYVTRMEELQQAVQSGCVTLALSDRGSGLFDMMDRDKDGRLSVREMRRVPELAATLDRNRDEQLARGEVPRSFELRVRQGPAGGINDLNQVVVVARGGRMDGPPVAPRTAGPMWFRKMDANRDGDLSRREFLGTDEDFKRYDKDADGLISADEAGPTERDTGRTPTIRR